jgi:ribonuclease Z
MEITILGTAGSMPTKDRNVSATFIAYKAEGLLFDCGEGTQRQLKKAGISLSKITKIFITHWHGDHVIGLAGLLQSLGLSLGEQAQAIELYGPVGTRERLGHMFHAFEFDRKLDLRVHEAKSGIILENKDFVIECAALKHRVTCLGYAFIERDKRRIDMKRVKKLSIPSGPLIGKLQEGSVIAHEGKKITPDMVSEVIPGKKVAYVTDTVVCQGAHKLAENADLLICESTYHSDLTEQAHEYAHMTAREAANIASQANAKKLILTHFSARYADATILEQDARTIFDNTQAAQDLMKIKL